MAGIGLEPQQNLEIPQLVQPLQAGVLQSAAAQLADAFRQGQITANDIIERYGTLAKTREKATIQDLDEFVSPEAIQSRKDVLQSVGARARLSGKIAAAALPSVGLAQDISEEQLQVASQQAKVALQEAQIAGPNNYGAMHKALRLNGVDIDDIPATGMTPELEKETKDKFRAYSRYAQTKNTAVNLLGKIKTKPAEHTTIKDGQTVTTLGPEQVHFDEAGNIIDEDTYKKLRALAHMDFNEHQEVPATVADVFSGAKTSDILKRQELLGERKKPTVESKFIPGISQLPKEEIPTPAPGGTVKAEGVVIKTEPAKLTEKAPTEAQQRAQLALSRFAESNNIQQSLKDAGYDPTAIWSWATSFFPEAIKPANRKAFDAAISLWSQGLLRLESGAAISRQEKTWYEKAFFPAVNDPPEVVMAKEKARHDVERMVSEIAQAGGVVSPESAAQARELYQQAGANAGIPATSTQAGRPSMESAAPGEKPWTAPSGKQLILTPQGWRYVQ